VDQKWRKNTSLTIPLLNDILQHEAGMRGRRKTKERKTEKEEMNEGGKEKTIHLC
jgi:hypothetical protein